MLWLLVFSSDLTVVTVLWSPTLHFVSVQRDSKYCDYRFNSVCSSGVISDGSVGNVLQYHCTAAFLTAWCCKLRVGGLFCFDIWITSVSSCLLTPQEPFGFDEVSRVRGRRLGSFGMPLFSILRCREVIPDSLICASVGIIPTVWSLYLCRQL